MNENNLATELLAEVKAGAKRWFIISVIELVIIVALSSLFVWNLSLPVEEATIEYTQEATDNDLSDIQQIIGEKDNGKSKTNSP